MPKYIVVVGGVISGVGKGVATASIAKILQEYGFSATAVKIDPYLNFDAGTLRPTEHGEVWVTDDGGEIDQDLGNYERFLNLDIPRVNNITTGQVYSKVIENERKGKYLGQTVQIIPHIPEEIKNRITSVGKGYDFILIEIGGTVGDYENFPFLFAMKSLEREIGEDNIIYILITYLPIPDHVGEMKTKPTQQAIKMLSETGIFPDFILCRARKPLDDVRKRKIEVYANIGSDYVISAPDIKKSIYSVPLNFEKDGLGKKILKKFRIQPKNNPDWKKWEELTNKIDSPKKTVKVAIVGKYVDIGDFALYDSYISVSEALLHAGASLDVGVDITWFDAKDFEKKPSSLDILKNFNGVIVPGGFGDSGVEGKISAIKFVRENKIPYLGLCYGLQLAVVEFARNICGVSDAHTTEVDSETENPVIDILPSQKSLIQNEEYGGTMRLGAYAAMVNDKTMVLGLYEETKRLEEDSKRLKSVGEAFRLGILNSNKKVILERHRHRYECNPNYISILEDKGLTFSGYHIRKDGTRLMEFIELKNHPFFVATQAHPEFKSRLGNPSPLFYGFVKAAKEKTSKKFKIFK